MEISKIETYQGNQRKAIKGQNINDNRGILDKFRYPAGLGIDPSCFNLAGDWIVSQSFQSDH